MDIETIDIKNWELIVSALIVVVGWGVTSYFNRIQDIANIRIRYRLDMFDSILVLWNHIQENGTIPVQDGRFAQLSNVRQNFQLYGRQGEIDSMEQFVKALDKEDLSESNKCLGKLISLSRKNIRKELRIKN